MMHPQEIPLPDTDGEQEESAAELLHRWITLPNIAEEVDDTVLSEIASAVTREYTLDKDSRSEWEDQNEDALKLAKQVAEEKSYPWAGAANIKFPLVQVASQQFAARAYPAIVRNDRVVKVNIPGVDPEGEVGKRAERVGRHMSYQLLNDMENWEEDTDTLLCALPIVGNAFRKTYYDPEHGLASKLILPEFFVVNQAAKDLETVPRTTEIVELYPREIEERIRGGLFLDDDYKSGEGHDDDGPQTFLEQHRFWDLDDDGYTEPYVVTLHEHSKKVARIVARFDADSVEVEQDGSVTRIKPVLYYTHYKFMPDPAGGFMGIGYGQSLGPMNKTINSTINQMLDAGHLANTGGGFLGAGLRLKGGNIKFRPGEYKNVPATADDLRKSIVSLSFPGPSPVLFQLLGLMIDAGKEAANVNDSMSGDMPAAGTPAMTTMAMIEQGHRVYSAIFKRVYRALKKEFVKLYRLDRLYPISEEMKQDFAEDAAIVPVADPNTATDMQRAAKAEALMQFREDPTYDKAEIDKYYIESIGIDGGYERFRNKQPPQPNPAMEIQQDLMVSQNAKIKAETILLFAEIDEVGAKTIKHIAEAEAEEAGIQMGEYMADVDVMKERARQQKDMEAARAKQQQMEQQRQQQMQQQQMQQRGPQG